MTTGEYKQTNSGRVRLITVHHLPGEGAGEKTPATISYVPSDCAVFENHYIQRKDWTHGEAANANSTLYSLVQRLNGRRLWFHAAQQAGSIASPEWFETRTYEFPQPSAEAIVADCTGTDNDALTWLHFDLPSPNAHETLKTIVEAIKTLIARDGISTILTPSAGSPAEAAAPFNALLPEAAIRVPLYLFLPDIDGCHIQTLTGSSDVVFTISQITGQPRNDASTLKAGVAHRDFVNLATVARSPGTAISRTLTIQHGTTAAVRTDAFLYVETSTGVEEGVSDRQTALYAKPEDVWNVHDVSGEYQSVVDAMAKRLPHAMSKADR